MRCTVSVVMCIRNVQHSIGACINSILEQTFKDFEIVLIDDFSTDNTKDVIESLKDSRLKYFRNPEWLGISKSRNIGLKHATGEYIFFTDGDCIVCSNWIVEGLKYLKTPNCIGVEGRICYVSEDFEPTFSDCILENRSGGNYMTGNLAFISKVLLDIGGFDEELFYLEDRDISLRAMKYGKILFNPNMIVYHPRVVLTPKQYLRVATRTKNRIFLYKKLNERTFLSGRIIYPLNLLKILFPPLIFMSLFYKKFKTKDDYRLVPYSYIYAIVERLNVWEECAKQRVFLI